MTKPGSMRLNMRGFALVAGLFAALGCSSAASADLQQQQDMAKKLDQASVVRNQAAQTLNEANQAYEQRDYDRACQLAVQSVEQWGDADRALARGIEAGWGYQADREFYAMIDEANADLKRGKKAAVAAKDQACSARGSARRPAAASSGSSQPALSDAANTYQTGELRDLVARSMGQANDAVSKYEANDRTGACASSRLSAEGLTKAVRAMQANPALEAAVANPAQVYENARQAVLDRDEFYCTR
jgi:hypothetical protein